MRIEMPFGTCSTRACCLTIFTIWSLLMGGQRYRIRSISSSSSFSASGLRGNGVVLRITCAPHCKGTYILGSVAFTTILGKMLGIVARQLTQ